MDVRIKNIRTAIPYHKWDVIVDRTSVLGNPFILSSESKRDEVCERYEKRFNTIQEEPIIKEELERLLSILKEYGQINLFCWCYPKRCHAETIKAWLERNSLRV